MQFREAGEGECRQIAGMVSALISELGGAGFDEIAAANVCEALLGNPDLGSVVVATDDSGTITGICCLSYQISVRTLGRYAIVQEMFIRPEHRGRKVGAQLLRRAIQIASSAGCSIVELGTPPLGERQRRFYEREGFSVVGHRMRHLLTG